MFVSVGEPMLELNYDPAQPESVIVGFGGDALNAAVMAARSGVGAALVGRVGNDATGARLLAFCAAEGVGTDAVIVDATAPTGIYSGEFGVDGARRFDYHRTGSAGSMLCPDDIDELIISTAAVLHVTGITLAVSESSARAAEHAVQLARQHNVLVSLSVNHRPKLGGDLDRLRTIARSADMLFASSDEAERLFGTSDVARIREQSRSERPEIVVTHGPAGAVVWAGDTIIEQPPLALGQREDTGRLDTTGAGDAVTGTYAAWRIRGAEPVDAIRYAVVAGSLACLDRGAARSYPSSSDVEAGVARLPAGRIKEAA